MEFFDSENYLRKIHKEFKQTDEFYDLFRAWFISEIYKLITEFYPKIVKNNNLGNKLKLYADEILSSTESVIYKDMSYPEYRIEDELRVMTRLTNKETNEDQNPEFIEKVHLKAKALMVEYYPNIIDLSANGFRLLEKNAKMYNREFVNNFYETDYSNQETS